MKSILVVDDSPTILSFVKKTLESAGYAVATTSDMWIASLVNRIQRVLVLIDVNLGVLKNGPVIVRALKRRQTDCRTKFVLYSSEPVESLRKLAQESGADGYIMKSKNPEDLRKAVERMISLQGVLDAAR